MRTNEHIENLQEKLRLCSRDIHELSEKFKALMDYLDLDYTFAPSKYVVLKCKDPHKAEE